MSSSGQLSAQCAERDCDWYFIRDFPGDWEPLLAPLAWPIAAVLIAFLFRQQLAEVVPRLKRISPNGIELAEAQGRGAHEIVPSKVSLDPAPLVSRERTQALKEVEEELRNKLQDTPEDELKDSLIYDLSLNKLDNHFWSVFNLVFGSQIRMLKYLKTSGGVRDATWLKDYFDSVRSENDVLKDWKQEEYVQFLQMNHIVKYDGIRIELTAIGDDFLLFIHRKNLPENRPF